MATLFILSIDGDGIRSIIPAVILVEPAKQLDGLPLHKAFDLIAGTSTRHHCGRPDLPSPIKSRRGSLHTGRSARSLRKRRRRYFPEVLAFRRLQSVRSQRSELQC